ncbi:MAG: acyl carrier protein [Lachnospiraceae bacterium]|nr:acyl carrier protein [Lachnospiraceae bacterium]
MLDQIKELLATSLSIDADTITEASRFSEDLGIDSLDIVELLMNVEEEFGVSIEPDPSIATVGDLIAKIEELRG